MLRHIDGTLKDLRSTDYDAFIPIPHPIIVVFGSSVESPRTSLPGRYLKATHGVVPAPYSEDGGNGEQTVTISVALSGWPVAAATPYRLCISNNPSLLMLQSACSKGDSNKGRSHTPY